MNMHVQTSPRQSRFPFLGSPIRLAGLEIRNRTAMAAMSSVLASERGEVTPELIGYYKARAAGGTGLITVEFTCVDSRYGRAETRQLALDNDAAIDGHRELVKVIKATGARAAIQLHAPGQHVDPRTLQGLPSGPSPEFSQRDSTLQISRKLEVDEIRGLIDAFARAAERAIEAGYEGIELHGAHGYLLMAFLSPLKNRRTDAWGGDEERRLAFPLAVIRAVKAVLGPERPLIYRLSSTDFLAGGLSVDDMVRLAPRLVDAGVDALHVSSGTIDGSLDMTVDPMSMPEGWRLSHSKAIKAAVSVPVMSVGPVRWPETAEKAIADGEIDMIALGRPLLADPDWVGKALFGAGRAIRPCTNCNWCFERVLRHGHIGCAENPVTGAETTLRRVPRVFGQSAIVIGGGPGGMAAALDFAEAGFATDLYEARDELGGGLIASASPPHKDKLFWYLDYLKDRLAESSVKVHVGAPATEAMLKLRRPDAVVVATGAIGVSFPVEGFDRPNVLSAYALLMNEIELPPMSDRPVVVYGGGETGCETAEYLAERGYAVVLVTRSSAKKLARAAEGMYRKHLRQRLLGNPNVTVRDNATIVSIGEDTIRLDTAAGEQEIAVSYVVMAQGRQTGNRLVRVLEQSGTPHELVGDVHEIGRIGDAVHAARSAVMKLAAVVFNVPVPGG